MSAVNRAVESITVILDRLRTKVVSKQPLNDQEAQFLGKAAKFLDDVRTRDILTSRNVGQDLKTIADRWNITPARVSQLIKQHQPK